MNYIPNYQNQNPEIYIGCVNHDLKKVIIRGFSFITYYFGPFYECNCKPPTHNCSVEVLQIELFSQGFPIAICFLTISVSSFFYQSVIFPVGFFKISILPVRFFMIILRSQSGLYIFFSKTEAQPI